MIYFGYSVGFALDIV